MDAGSYAGVASIWPPEVQADCKAWWTVVSAPGVASTLFGRRDVITGLGLLLREVKKVGFARQPIRACVHPTRQLCRPKDRSRCESLARQTLGSRRSGLAAIIWARRKTSRPRWKSSIARWTAA